MCAESKGQSFDNFHPVVTKRASEAIYEQVRALIMSGELKPGDRLPSERNMMETFQRSRPTIREALRMLERSGYIKATAGSSGAVIMEQSGKNVQQVMEDALQIGTITLREMGEYRRISERATVTWAAERCTDEDVAKLRELMDRMRENVDNYERFIGMDPMFHGLIAAAAKNQVSVTMNRTFSKLNESFITEKMEKMKPMERLTMCCRIQQMHEDIFDAVSAHDPEGAREAMERHMYAFEEDLTEA